MKSVEITLQHSHCTWVQLQVTEREKCDHHYQNQHGKIGHSSLQDQMAAEPRHTNILYSPVIILYPKFSGNNTNLRGGNVPLIV